MTGKSDYILSARRFAKLFITAWYNWLGWITILPAAGQAATNFLISTLQLADPRCAILDSTISA
jgi:hypothetical protein